MSVNVATLVNEQMGKEPVTQITESTDNNLKHSYSDNVLTKLIDSEVPLDPDCSQSDKNL